MSGWSKVKPLVWRGHGDCLDASALGLDVFYRVSGEPGNWTLTSPGTRSYVETPGYESQSAAKSAAQVDYDRRILAALDLPAPPSPDTEGER